KNDGNVEETWKQVQTAWGSVRDTLAPPEQDTQPSPPQQAEAAKPEPAQPAPAPQPAPSEADLTVEVKRGMPGNAELIANFISSVSGSTVSRMDIMLAFGQKSYLFAEDGQSNQI